jgi:hypothetical protein
MANMREVNKAIKNTYPNLDIVLYRGDGYFYFGGLHGEILHSVWSHPPATSTENAIKFALSNIKDVYNGLNV